MKAISMRRNSGTQAGERGNAFIFVLLGIVLFSALAFTISRSMQGQTSSTMSARDSELAAADIVSYAQKIERAVDRVRRQGCSESDISFKNAAVSGYAHTPDVEDQCQVFGSAGGSANWLNPPPRSNDGSPWFFGDNRVGTTDNAKDIGSAAADLVMILPAIDKTLCDKINERANQLIVWESSGSVNDSTKFTGDYDTAAAGINRGTDWPIPATGCFCDSGGACDDASPRYFYHVLLAR